MRVKLVVVVHFDVMLKVLNDDMTTIEKLEGGIRGV